MKRKRILLVLGGTWHNFDGFQRSIGLLLVKAGYTVSATYELDALTTLRRNKYDAVVLYTCLTAKREDGSRAGVRLTDEQAAPLAKWVAAGGALLAVHGATVSGQSSPVFRRLVGGAFVKHPPAKRFTVYPLSTGHPVTTRLDAFEVHDELYIQQCDPGLTVHMVAIHDGVAHPMVWSRTEGRGRVVYVALGHDERVWRLREYRQLVGQVMKWLANQV